MRKVYFEWDEEKNQENQVKHGVPFSLAQLAFLDPKRVIAKDVSHSTSEARFFCMGQVEGGIVTVRFTLRQNMIRIFGAGYWRKGKKLYEEKNKIHK